MTAPRRTQDQRGCRGERDDIGIELGARTVTELVNNSVWIALRLAIGLGAGWLLAGRQLGRQKDDAIESDRNEEQRRRRELSATIEKAERQNAALQADDKELRRQLELSVARADQMAIDARERARDQDRAEARIFDRESTIDSLRAKLFAARNTSRNLEKELEGTRAEFELLKKHFNALHAAKPDEVDESDALSSIVVDLGDTLSVERD